MNDLHKAAQAVDEAIFRKGYVNSKNKKDLALIIALRQALAEPVTAFAVVRYPKIGGNAGIAWAAYPHEDFPYFPKDGDLLYIAPPSIDALIADIDGLVETHSDTSPSRPAYMKADVQSILDNYRSK